MTKCTYVGIKVTKDGNSESEVNARITIARGAFAALKNIWKTNKIRNRTKISMFKSNVLNVLLYAVESWKVTRDISDARSFFLQNKCLMKICESIGPTKFRKRNSMKEQACSPSLSTLNAAHGNGSATYVEYY